MAKPVSLEEVRELRIAVCCVKPVHETILFDSLIQALAQQDQPDAIAVLKSAEKATLPLPRRKERVLLAEDNVVNQRVALGHLEKLGYVPDVVTNGIAVLEALERERYDVILMDCQMPDLDGYEATKEIRRREKNSRHTWIIAMTANVMVGDRREMPRHRHGRLCEQAAPPRGIERGAATLVRGKHASGRHRHGE